MRKSNSAIRVLLTLCTFPTHWVSSQQETTASKIPIAFLFSQLHFNNVTSHALFLRRPSCYAQWEMRSAKPGNHLKHFFFQKTHIFTCCLLRWPSRSNEFLFFFFLTSFIYKSENKRIRLRAVSLFSWSVTALSLSLIHIWRCRRAI